MQNRQEIEWIHSGSERQGALKSREVRVNFKGIETHFSLFKCEWSI